MPWFREQDQWNEVLAKGITNVVQPPVISQDLKYKFDGNMLFER